MGMLGGCAAVALMWWAQAPLLDALERTPDQQPQPGQLLHPLVVQIDAPAEPPPAEDGAWSLESVAVHLDGEKLVETAAPAAVADQPVWEGALTPGPHTLLSLFTFRREGAADDDPGARVRVERPQVFQSRPGRPLALNFAPVGR